MYMISAAMTKMWRPPVDWYSRTDCRSLTNWNAPTTSAGTGFFKAPVLVQMCRLAAPLTKEETLILTYSSGLQQECDDAEEVDISVINRELHKDCSSVPIQPLGLGEITEDPVNYEHRNVQNVLSFCKALMKICITLLMIIGLMLHCSILSRDESTSKLLNSLDEEWQYGKSLNYLVEEEIKRPETHT